MNENNNLNLSVNYSTELANDISDEFQEREKYETQKNLRSEKEAKLNRLISVCSLVVGVLTLIVALLTLIVSIS